MYQKWIREELARAGLIGVNAGQVEAWMRLECGTLDGLDRARFRKEVLIGAQCVAADPVASARLAESYGVK